MSFTSAGVYIAFNGSPDHEAKLCLLAGDFASEGAKVCDCHLSMLSSISIVSDSWLSLDLFMLPPVLGVRDLMLAAVPGGQGSSFA